MAVQLLGFYETLLLFNMPFPLNFIAFFGFLWCLSSLIFFPINLAEILKERKFKQRAKPAMGTVIGFLSAKAGKINPLSVQIPSNTPLWLNNFEQKTTILGVLLKIKFEANGYIYEVSSRRVYQKETAPQTVEILYDPEDPFDVMINGYYITGNSKYVFAALSFVGLLPWVVLLAALVFN